MVPWFVLFFVVTCGIGYVEHQRHPDTEDATQLTTPSDSEIEFMRKTMGRGIF
jgi:hypothetical protein